MKTIKKIITITAIILFPLFMLYCIGKNLWNRGLIEFLGGLFLLITGFIIAVFVLRPDIVEPIINFFKTITGA